MVRYPQAAGYAGNEFAHPPRALPDNNLAILIEAPFSLTHYTAVRSVTSGNKLLPKPRDEK